MHQCTTVPDVTGLSVLEAALRYAEFGIHVVPTSPRIQNGVSQIKNPGSIVGRDWPGWASKNPDQIREWFTGHDEYGIMTEPAKNGWVVLDVDHPENVTEERLVSLLAKAPAHRTRKADDGTGHYFFLQPPGRNLGSKRPPFWKDIGDIRSFHGGIVLPPTKHPKPYGAYTQKRVGPKHQLFHLPEWFANDIRDAEPGERPLTSLEWKRLLREHDKEENTKLLNNALRKLEIAILEEGQSRHENMPISLCWVFREAIAGYYSMQEAYDAVNDFFKEALKSDVGNGIRAMGDGEWHDLVMWSAANATKADPADTRAAVEARKARKAVREDGLYTPGYADTDQEHAQAVIKWISDRAVYAWDADSWIIKRENKWTVSPKAEGRGIVTLTAKNMPMGTEPEEDKPAEWTDENWAWHWRQKYQSAQKSSGISTKINGLVMTDDGSSPYTVSLGDVDTDPDVLWTPTGPIDLLPDRRQDEPINHTAIHLHCTRFTPLEVETPCWDTLLEAVWPDPAIRAWALQLMAVGITGLSPKMFLYLHGAKNRGKTSVPMLIADALGSYAKHDLRKELLNAEAKPWDRAALHGLRFGLIDEMPRMTAAPTESLKKYTGGTSINAEYKGKPQFTFSPTHTLVIASNAAPDTHDEAVVERLRAIACVGSPARVRAARAKLGELNDRVWLREGPGVLWQMVELARNYRRNADVVNNESAPGVIRKKTAALRSEQNVLADWLEEYTDIVKDEGKDKWSSPTQIYDAFMKWCRQNHRGRRYLSDGYGLEQMGKEISYLAGRRGYVKGRNKRGNLWNIDLNPANIKAGMR